MTLVPLRYVQTYKVRGRTYFYYRREGMRQRLEGEPGTPVFLASYRAADVAANARAKGQAPEDRTAVPGSFMALVMAYRMAPEYRRLAPKTQRSYERVLAPLLKQDGDLFVRQMPRAWVLACRDALQDKPPTANYLLAVLRRVLAFAVDREWRPDNPALRIPGLKTGDGHRRWTEDEIAAMTGPDAPPEIRLPVLIGLHTAQRQGDVLKMLWASISDEAIAVRQGKTGVSLRIPLHPELIEALDKAPKMAALICTTTTGRKWTGDHFRGWFAKARADLGLAPDLTFHGLRHTAASRMAEAGSPDAEIQAMTGHKSRSMVARYSAQASQHHMAQSAVTRLQRTKENKKNET